MAVGEMELLMEGDDGINTIVGRVGPSGHFGETSLITNKPQSLTIRSLCDSGLLCFTDRFFRRQLGECRIVQEQIEAALAERLRLSFQNLSSGLQACDISTREEIRIVDMMPLNGDSDEADEAGSKERIMRSQSAKEIQSAIERFSSFDEPVLLTGESGTGRRLIAKQIHLQGNQAQGPYIEIDVRDFSADELAKKLFGDRHDFFPFSQVKQTGILEQFCRGTVLSGNSGDQALRSAAAGRAG